MYIYNRRMLACGNEDSGHVMSVDGSTLTLTATFTVVKQEAAEEEVRECV